MWLQNLSCPYYHELNFSKNMADFINSIENLHCPNYQEVKLAQKESSFVDATSKFGLITSWHFAKKKSSRFDFAIWKFKLPLLSRGKSAHENETFLYNHLKVRPSRTITSWSSRKNKAVLLRYFENLYCDYNHELKFAEQ